MTNGQVVDDGVVAEAESIVLAAWLRLQLAARTGRDEPACVPAVRAALRAAGPRVGTVIPLSDRAGTELLGQRALRNAPPPRSHPRWANQRSPPRWPRPVGDPVDCK